MAGTPSQFFFNVCFFMCFYYVIGYVTFDAAELYLRIQIENETNKRLYQYLISENNTITNTFSELQIIQNNTNGDHQV